MYHDLSRLFMIYMTAQCECEQTSSNCTSGFEIFHRPFAEMEEALEGEEVDGVLMDLGVSNNQADQPTHFNLY